MARIGSSTNTNCGRDGRFWEPRGSVIEGEVVPEPEMPPNQLISERTGKPVDTKRKSLWERMVDWFE